MKILNRKKIGNETKIQFEIYKKKIESLQIVL